MEPQSKEVRFMLAIQALERGPNFSIQRAAAVYEVPFSAVRRRRDRVLPSRRDCTAKSQHLTDLQESTIAQYILDLDTRSYSP
jgi:hypothetical protein